MTKIDKHQHDHYNWIWKNLKTLKLNILDPKIEHGFFLKN